jgi:hypothetical protein
MAWNVNAIFVTAPMGRHKRNRTTMKLIARFGRTGLSALAFLLLLMLAAPRLQAQTTNADLSGTIADTLGGRIPGAKVTLTNDDSKVKRSTVADGEGVFDFTAVSAGTYTLNATSPGFETFIEKQIKLHPGDRAQLPPVAMKIGAQETVVEVTARDLEVQNGEVSSVITADDIDHLATEGRDVTELLKILPGFALQPGGASASGISNAAPDTTSVGPGGSLGNYSASGSPSMGIGLISDSANVQDPGTGGASTQTINMDMVQEVKVTTANFGADVAKGPVVINAVGKSGGQVYHGAVYLIGRTYQLNSQDWLLNQEGLPKPKDRYIYPGFNIGGPLLIPGTNFNRGNPAKLTFFAGGEDYVQRNTFSGGSAAGAVRLSTVPTDAMRGGDFSGNSLIAFLNDPYLYTPPPGSGTNGVADCSANGRLNVFLNYCNIPAGYDPKGNFIQGGVFPAADIDPGALAYLKFFPHANRTPQPVLGTTQPSDGFDRQDVNLTNNNLWQARGRLDYNYSEASKAYFVFNVEEGRSFAPYTLYYNPSYNNGIVTDPSQIVSGVYSRTASANYVHTFSPTLTSEAFVAGSFYFNPLNAVNESVQTKAALGYPYAGLFNNGSRQLPQLGYSSGVPLYLGPDFSIARSFSRKLSVDFGENITKVLQKHTLKVGFYFERTANNQLTGTGATQGTLAEYGNYAAFRSPYTTQMIQPGNTITQFLFGEANYYAQQFANPTIDLNYTAIDGYATDSWKATRQLTIDFGVRFDHLGPWEDSHHQGPIIFNPSTYYTPSYTTSFQNSAGQPDPSQLPGITYYGKDHTSMTGAELARWAFVSPRVGLAYDLFRDGKTLFNGGVGLYRNHDSYNAYTNAFGLQQGNFSESYYLSPTLYCVNAIGTGDTSAIAKTTCPNGAANLNGFSANQSISLTAVDPHDDQQPLTTTYSFGVNQRLPHAGNLILTYSGNQTSHLLIETGFGQNINTIPQGKLFGADPNPKSPNFGEILVPDSAILDDFRPYPFYNSINVVRHGLHSSYNSLQASLNKYSGHFLYGFNYTWSRAMGDRGAAGGGSVADATNLRNDYGILAIDRTNVANASYTYVEGKAFHASRFVSGFVNNWEISGITNLASGPDLQAAFGNNFNLTLQTTSTNVPTDNKTYLGTPDILLQPTTTCDISTGLKKNQFVNAACLTIGPIGVNGPFTYPTVRGPAFFNSDLSLRKGFDLGNKRRLQFRFAAFNFLNHPLTSLVAGVATPLRLVISGVGQPANSAFGVSAYKQGRRVSEAEVRYTF